MIKKLFTAVLVALCSSSALAWNATIHMAVVELALQQLSPRSAQELNNIAYDLVVEFDSERRLNLMRQYQDTSWLAQLSVTPDWDRDILLDDLFAHYELEVPAPLAAERARNTAHWHYINRALSTGDIRSQCEFDDGANLVSVMPLLLDSYDSAESDKARALLLSFIVHLVADAHQPLHNLTRADAECSHDSGGNGFCASTRTIVQRCEENLHQLWDDAFGLFDDLELVSDVAHRISLVRIDEVRAADLNAQHWSDESFAFGRFVYSTSENRNPDSAYVREAKAISAERLQLAAKRLGQILQSL